jgi:hypothetical protein
MSNTKNRLAILLITLFFIGSAAAGTEKEMTPSGTIHFEEWQVMAILGGDWGHGTLGYNGKVYKFKITGMGAGGMGAQKISATGDVYNLKEISDFPGGYSELRGGIAAGKGVGGLYVRNDKGVVIKLKTHGEGVALSVGVQGITIQMEK